MRESQSRRAFLGATLAAGAASVAYPVVAQEAQPDFELGGRVSGWQGIAPDVIAETENPTLTLLEGEEYVLVWSNEDGRGHNFSIETEGGEDLLATDIIASGSQTVEFTASAEMYEYYCQPHPQSMRGSIEITDDPEAEGVISPDRGEQMQEEDQEQTQQPTGEPTETFEFVLTEEGWQGQSPDAIADRRNPTLSLTAGEVYEVVASTELAKKKHLTPHVFTVIDDEGQEVAHTNFLRPGQSQSVRFVAEDRFARYIDETQLDVGGDIKVSGADGGADGGGAQNESEQNTTTNEKSEEREERKGETEDGRDGGSGNESENGS